MTNIFFNLSHKIAKNQQLIKNTQRLDLNWVFSLELKCWADKLLFFYDFNKQYL